MDAQDFTQTYHTNTTAVFFSVVAFLDLLDRGNKNGNVEQKSQVIATSSIGAYNRNAMAGYAYGTSKAAVLHMMKQFSTAFASYQIRSNIVAPGCKYLMSGCDSSNAKVLRQSTHLSLLRAQLHDSRTELANSHSL